MNNLVYLGIDHRMTWIKTSDHDRFKIKPFGQSLIDLGRDAETGHFSVQCSARICEQNVFATKVSLGEHFNRSFRELRFFQKRSELGAQIHDELEKRWNHALEQVAEMERRLEEAAIAAPQLTSEQRDHLLTLGDDLERLWDHPNSPATLKKRILRTGS